MSIWVCWSSGTACPCEADSSCGSPDEAALYRGSQSPGPPKFTLFPQKPSVSYFAAVWGRVSWLLSLYEEAQPLLWESKRQCGTLLQKMADPFISEFNEEDMVVHLACWMLPAKLLGQHRRTTAPQSPKPTQGPAPHRDFSLLSQHARNRNNCNNTSHANSYMSWPLSLFLTWFGLAPTLNSLWIEDTSD